MPKKNIDDMLAEFEIQRDGGPQLNDSLTHYIRNNLVDENFEALNHTISTTASFKSLVAGFGSEEDLANILEAIKANGNIENLDISSVYFYRDTTNVFIDFIKEYTPLKKLKFDASSLCIMPSYLLQIRKGLFISPVKKITNIIRSDALIKALMNSSLTSITFRLWNRPPDIGKTFNNEAIEALSEFLNNNKLCVHLGFKGIEINNLEKWSTVFAGLVNNTTLTSLYFKNCNFNQQTLAALLKVLQTNTTLQAVEFKQDDMSHAGFEEIANLLMERNQSKEMQILCKKKCLPECR